MLMDLRETIRNSKPIKYTLVGVITVVFAGVGLGSYFAGGSAPPVAHVNGEEISGYELEGAIYQQRQQLARMFGGNLPEGFGSDEILRSQALEQLISQRVLNSNVAAHKFAVGDETLGRSIRQLPNFQVDGQFDRETYELALRSSGMSVPAFEQNFRDNTAVNQFRNGVIGTSFTLKQEAEALGALTRQTRTVDTVTFDFATSKEGIEVSDEDVTKFFDENSGNYNAPERAKIQYIELNSQALADNVDVTDEDAEIYYEDNKALYVISEQREASHILLEVDVNDADEVTEKASVLNDLKLRIEAGESFADLAREFSDDIGSSGSGGNLGIIAPFDPSDQFPSDQALADALYQLEKEGSISEPVVSSAGVHLLKVDRVIEESGKPFDEVKEEIIAEIKQDQADTEYFDLREILSEQSFDAPESLEPASDVSGLELKTSDWIDVTSNSDPVLSNHQVLAAAFSPDVKDDGNNSELIEIGERHVVVLRVLEYEDERPQTLDEVRDEVVDSLKSERAGEALNELSVAANDRLLAGESAEDIAESDDLASAATAVVLSRQSTEFDRPVMDQLYALPKPVDGKPVTHNAVLGNGNRVAVRLVDVGVPEADEEAPAAAGTTVGANPRLGGVEFQALMQSLREDADVDIASP